MLNLKTFSFALMALAAFNAVATQSASAVPLTVEPLGSKVFITDTSETGVKFTTSGTFECKQGIARGSALSESGGIYELTLTPEYKECISFGFGGGDIKVNGCTYTLTTPTVIKAGEATYHGSQFHIVCQEGRKMELTPTGFGVSLCTQWISAQTPTEGHILARNVPGSSPMDITFEYTLKGTHYTGTGGACGTSGTTGELVANTTGKCFKDEAHTVQISCTFS